MIFKKNIQKQKADLEAKLKLIDAEIIRLQQEAEKNNTRFMIKDNQIFQFKIEKETKKSVFVKQAGTTKLKSIPVGTVFKTIDEAKDELVKLIEVQEQALAELKKSLKRI